MGEGHNDGAQPTSAIMTLRSALAMEASTPTRSNSIFDGVRRWTETTRFCACGQRTANPTLRCGADGKTHLLEPLQRPGVILAWIMARKLGASDLYKHQLRPRDHHQYGLGGMPGPGEELVTDRSYPLGQHLDMPSCVVERARHIDQIDAGAICIFCGHALDVADSTTGCATRDGEPV